MDVFDFCYSWYVCYLASLRGALISLPSCSVSCCLVSRCRVLSERFVIHPVFPFTFRASQRCPWSPAGRPFDVLVSVCGSQAPALGKAPFGLQSLSSG